MSDTAQERADDEPTRSEIRYLIGALINDLAPSLDRARRLRLNAEEELSDSLSRRRELKINSRLRSSTVESLIEDSKIPADVADELRRRNIDNALDIANLTDSALEAIPKLGAARVKILRRRVNALAKERATDSMISGSVDLWDGADEAVGRALTFWYRIGQLTASSSVRALELVVRDLGRTYSASTWYRWLLLGRRRKAQIAGEFNDLARRAVGIEQGSDYQRLASDLKKLGRGGGANLDRSLWSERSAELLSELENFRDRQRVARGEEPDLGFRLSEHGLSHGLISRMNALELNLSLVKRGLRRYQKEGARFALCANGALLGDEMGLGKTTQALAAIAHCYAAEQEIRHIVVCPAALIGTWEEEASEVVPDIPVLRFHGKSRDSSYAQWADRGGLLVTSYEHTRPLLAKDPADYGMLVVDEAHRIKSPDAQRTRRVDTLSKAAKRKLLMTGTPLINGFSDMLTILAVADPALAAQLAADFGPAPDRFSDADRIQVALSEHYLRRKQADVLGELPPLLIEKVEVDLSSQERQEYSRQVRARNFMGMRRSTTVCPGSATAKMRELKQIVSDAADANEKVLVFSFFKDVLDEAARVIGRDAFLIHGDFSPSENARSERDFKSKDGYAALVGQISMMGEGKNLQEASVVVLMEPQLAPVYESQAIARAHRMRQDKRVICTRMIARESVDERIEVRLKEKLQLMNSFANASELADTLLKEPLLEISEQELMEDELRRLGIDPDQGPK
ncbi:DEAD/DEAH box helicase [Cryptosporangium sp. NPDC051539]|uniref:DEAD/DEAH box helicase n=1 Tax=Cryptosporangium sp. NPDC051539 TaxID=3363962 RepID=UPI0037B062BA